MSHLQTFYSYPGDEFWMLTEVPQNQFCHLSIYKAATSKHALIQKYNREKLIDPMETLLRIATSLAFACQLLMTAVACPTPAGCASTTNCATIDYLNNLQTPPEISASLNPQQIINPAISTSSLNGFNTFKTFSEDDFNQDHEIELEDELITSSNASCLLDNQQGEQCKYKLIATRSDPLLCGWEYYCDYKKNRVPQYIWRAQCIPSRQPNTQSIPVYYKIPILELQESSNPGNCNPFENSNQGVWEWKQLEVAVACTCAPSPS